MNLAGLTAQGPYGIGPIVQASGAFVGVGVNGPMLYLDSYIGLSGPNQFRHGDPVYGTGGTGALFALCGGCQTPIVFLSHGYISGTLFSSSATFNNQSIASLGLNSGQYVYVLPSDTITVNIPFGTTPAVPEPAIWATMLAGFGLIGCAMRRRRDARGHGADLLAEFG